MDQDPLVILCDRPFHALTAFPVPGKIQGFSGRDDTDVDIVLPVYPRIGIVRIHDRRHQHIYISHHFRQGQLPARQVLQKLSVLVYGHTAVLVKQEEKGFDALS